MYIQASTSRMSNEGETFANGFVETVEISIMLTFSKNYIVYVCALATWIHLRKCKILFKIKKNWWWRRHLYIPPPLRPHVTISHHFGDPFLAPTVKTFLNDPLAISSFYWYDSLASRQFLANSLRPLYKLRQRYYYNYLHS